MSKSDINAMFQMPRLEFATTRASKKKIVLVSALPFLVFSAILTRLALELVFGGVAFFGLVPDNVPDFWGRLALFANGVWYMEHLAVAALFLSGVVRWSRSEASWMLGIGAALSVMAALAGVFNAVASPFANDPDNYNDLRLYSWSQVTFSLALLAIGYFFLAYRGLAATQETEEGNAGTVEPPPGPAPVEG